MNKPLKALFGSIVQRVDNATGNKLLLATLNREIKDFGEITNILIDVENKSIAIDVSLKGEDQPISIRINGYEIESDGDGSLVQIGDFSCTREWLDVIAKKFLTNRKLTIPLSPDMLGQIL